jgi:hypothetical protein
MATQLKIDLIVDDKGTVKIKQFTDGMSSEVKKSQQHLDNFAKSATTAFALVAGYLSGGAILSGLKSVTTAYMEQERAVNKMSVAMKNQGDFSQAGLKGMEDYASQIQATSAVADEQALSVMANLKSYGMLNDEVKRAAQVAFDFAAAKKEEGMTIEAASELLGKVYMGQTDRLKRYGIVIDDTLKGADKFNAVMKQLQERFGGAAAAELDTYEGAWKQLSNTWGDVKEDLGNIVLIMGETLQPALKSTVGLLKDAARYWKEFMGVSAESTLKKRQVGILDELGTLETKYPNRSPNYFGQDEARFPAGVAEKYAALNRELQTVTRSLRGIAAEEEKILPGGKRTIVPQETQVERDKWLSDYLRDVDKRWEAEAKRSEAIGDLTLLDQKWQEQAREKQLKQEQEYYKTLDDIKLAQIEGEIAAREEAMKSMTDLTATTAEAMEKNFSSLFFDAMTGKFTSLGDYATAIFRSIQQAAANYLGQIVTDLLFGGNGKQGRTGGGLGSLLGLFGGGAGAGAAAGAGMSSELMSMASVMMHRGGVVGDSGTPRVNVPAYAFSGAPRLHGGLAFDEFPAILQKGETVVPKNGMAQTTDKTSLSVPPSLTIVINAVDAASFAQLTARNPNAITGPVMEALQRGGQLRNLIRSTI